jgi:hypothetical protein
MEDPRLEVFSLRCSTRFGDLRTAHHHSCRECRGRKPAHRSEYLGGGEGHEPFQARRFPDLADVGFRQERVTDRARWCQRDGQRKERVCLLHQPDAGEYSHATRRDAGFSRGAGDEQRPCRRPVQRSGAAALTVVFRVQRGTLRGVDAREWSAVGTCEFVSGFDHSGQARGNSGALRERIRIDFRTGGQRSGDTIGKEASRRR